MPFEMKILVCQPPFPPLTEDEVTREEATKFVRGLVETLKKEPGWTFQSSSAPAPPGSKDTWHEFKLIKGPLHEKHGL